MPMPNAAAAIAVVKELLNHCCAAIRITAGAAATEEFHCCRKKMLCFLSVGWFPHLCDVSFSFFMSVGKEGPCDASHHWEVKTLFTGGSEIRVSEFWGYNILPQEGSNFFCAATQKKNQNCTPPTTMSSVRTKRQKKDAVTPAEPPPAPVIARPYNMDKEAAPWCGWKEAAKELWRASVECDPSCRMAAAILGAQCEYETLIVFIHL